jgi:hypothetical protein
MNKNRKPFERKAKQCFYFFLLSDLGAQDIFVYYAINATIRQAAGVSDKLQAITYDRNIVEVADKNTRKSYKFMPIKGNEKSRAFHHTLMCAGGDVDDKVSSTITADNTSTWSCH